MRLTGKVIKHKGRGKNLGFPTANLDVEADLEEGIYLGLVTKIEGDLPPLFKRKLWPKQNLIPTIKGLPALVFVGKARTFAENKSQTEVYILDFTYEIYDQVLEVEIIKKIRDNEKFETQEALIDQMKEDELKAREFFYL